MANKDNERFVNLNKWQAHKQDLINSILEKQTGGEFTREQLEEMENLALEIILYSFAVSDKPRQEVNR